MERRLAPAKDLKAEAVELLPRTAAPDGKKRKDTETFKETLQSESTEKVLLCCLLRESGEDIRDGLERPIGTRCISLCRSTGDHEVPRPRLQNQARTHESVNLVRYSLNTSAVNRAVLPPANAAINRFPNTARNRPDEKRSGAVWVDGERLNRGGARPHVSPRSAIRLGDQISDHEAFVLAYFGHLQQATRMSRRAADLAQQAAKRESAALYETGAALWEAFFGNAPAARQSAVAALEISKGRGCGVWRCLSAGPLGGFSRVSKTRERSGDALPGGYGS
ncbi:MAG: hypothetical protein ACR2NN_19550 [Bryobacteraceae bacterium]